MPEGASEGKVLKGLEIHTYDDGVEIVLKQADKDGADIGVFFPWASAERFIRLIVGAIASHHAIEEASQGTAYQA